MTVLELIAELEKLPPNLQVYAENQYTYGYKVKEVTISKNSNNQDCVVIKQQYP